MSQELSKARLAQQVFKVQKKRITKKLIQKRINKLKMPKSKKNYQTKWKSKVKKLKLKNRLIYVKISPWSLI